MEPNTRFKAPISFLSVATITVAAILFTNFVMNHKHVQPGTEGVLIFAVIFFGPVTLLYVRFSSGWPIGIGKLVLPISALTALLASSLLHSRYSAVLRGVGWFLWVLCALVVAGSFI